jgi:hypothetical protein
MGKERFFARGGVRSFKKKYDDDTEDTFYYQARTPSECAAFRGALTSFQNDEAGFVARDKYMGKFIAGAMSDEAGAPLLTEKECERIPDSLKLDLCLLIMAGSVETGDAGKG